MNGRLSTLVLALRAGPLAALVPASGVDAVHECQRSDHEQEHDYEQGSHGHRVPDGLAGRAIPLGARIVAVCDAYRAMSEDRPYRSALSEDDARDELERGAGGHFDADCVAALLRALDRRDHTATVVALRPPGSAASAPHRQL